MALHPPEAPLTLNHICSHRIGDHRKRKTYNTRQTHKKQGLDTKGYHPTTPKNSKAKERHGLRGVRGEFLDELDLEARGGGGGGGVLGGDGDGAMEVAEEEGEVEGEDDAVVVVAGDAVDAVVGDESLEFHGGNDFNGEIEKLSE
ncbi:hypothetical protein DEO72_LG2g4362 [Vigna unguiculata]|uniref:Uncharacterized protein n=1 Tax=Vigna unguiculata TaxID=3917 RepID=A0A4D6L652_VIGUN|nr:hypothetical protein DEO72_LG2g4362 [Vigna unguiculata]